MSAEPIDPGVQPWSPDPARQRLADFTIEDVLALPDDAPRAELVDERDRHFLMPHQVTLVVEIVSPGTRRRDRLEKPAGYAEAGIPYFWRVEQKPVQAHAYKLADGGYKEQASSVDELVLDEPFPIRLPIREITP